MSEFTKTLQREAERCLRRERMSDCDYPRYAVVAREGGVLERVCGRNELKDARTWAKKFHFSDSFTDVFICRLHDGVTPIMERVQ